MLFFTEFDIIIVNPHINAMFLFERLLDFDCKVYTNRFDQTLFHSVGIEMITRIRLV